MSRKVAGTIVAALLFVSLFVWTGCSGSKSDAPQAIAANGEPRETQSPAKPPKQKEDSFAPRGQRSPAPDAFSEPDPTGAPEAATPAEVRPSEEPSPADEPAPATPGPRVFATPTGEPDVDAPISAESDAMLERFHDEDRIEEFAALLADRNPLVRLAAAKNANYANDRSKVVDPLIKLLLDPNAEIRQAAAASLSRSSGEFEQVVPALAETLFDPDADVARTAAESIGAAKEKGEAAVPQLRAVIARDRADRVSVEAIEALGLIGPAARPAVPRLIELLDMRALLQDGAGLDEAWDSGQRIEAAATALGRLGEGAPLVERAEKLAAANDLKESSYFEGLGYVYPTTDAIVERLEHGATSDENKITHYLAIQALGHCRPANARVLAALERVLKSESEEDRAYAARALGEIDPKLDAAFGLLLASAAEETSSDVKEAITGALGNYPIDSPNRLSQILAAAIQGANETEAEDIGQTINFRMDSPTPEIMERYAAFAEDAERSPVERALALDVLTDFDRGKGRPRAQEIADRVLDSAASGPDERVAAAMALMPERENDRRLGPALREGLASAKLAYHREGAAEWLASDDFEAPESDAALIAALDDPSGAVRKRAAAGVGQRGLTAAVDRLIVMSTDDAHEWARNEAATALGEMGASAKAAVPILLGAMRTEENTWFAEHAAVSAVRIALAAELDLAPIAERLTEDLQSEEWHLSDAGAIALSLLPPEQIALAVPALIAVAEKRERSDVSEDVQEALRAAGPLAADAAPVLLSKIEILVKEKRWGYDAPSLIETLGATQGHPDDVLPALAALIDSESSDEGRRRLSAAAAEGIVAYGEAGRPFLPQVVKALELPDAEFRSSIVEALGSAGNVAADTVPALKRLAEEDPTDWVRLAAFEALLRIDPSDAEILAKLAEAAVDEEANDRSRAFRNSDLETRVAILRTAIKHDDAAVRAGILRLAQGYARTDYLDVLREALDDDDAAVRSQAALALADQGEGNDRTAAILLESLDSGNLESESVDRAITILSRSGPSGRAAVLRILSDETRDESFRLALARTMIQDYWTVDRDAAQALRPSLAANNPSLRCAAAILLVRSKRYAGGVEPFVAALGSADPDRTIAADAASQLIGPLGSQPSLAETDEELLAAKEALFERLEAESEDDSVRAAAARSLASYAQDHADRSRLEKLLADEENRNFGILALPPSSDQLPQALAAALDLFSHEDYFTRSSAQRVLARAGDAGTEALAAIALDDGEEEDRRIAALAILANANVPPATREALRPLAETPDASAVGLLAIVVVEDRSETGGEAIDRLLAAYPPEDYRAHGPVHQFLTTPGSRSEQVALKTLERWRSDETATTPQLAELLVATAPDSEQAARAIVDKMRASAEEDEYDSFSYVLTQFGGAAVPALRETLSGEWSTEAKTRAARALRGMVFEGGDDESWTSESVDLSSAVPELTTLVASDDEELSLTAAETLVAIEPSDAGWERIGAALTHDDDGLRSRALSAIAAGKSPPVALLDPVVAAMDEEELVWNAPAALAAFGDGAAPHVPRLVSALDDEKRRQPSLQALTRLGPAASEALPKLLARVGDGQSEGGFMIPSAIHAVDPEGNVAVEALRSALADSSRAEAAAKTLAQYGEKAGAAGPELLALLDSDDLPTRLAALDALTAIGQPTSETTAKIVERIEAGRPEERTQAMTAAGTWKSPEALPALIASLDDGQAYVRRGAMHSLGEFEGGGGGARSALRAILARGEDALAEDRTAALRALARVGLETSDVPLLLTELKSQDEPLVLAAVDGLASLGDADSDAVASGDAMGGAMAALETIYTESPQRSYVRERAGVAIRAISSDRADELGIPVETSEE